MNEVKLLLQYGFTQEEINQRCRDGSIHLLHKLSMINAAADVAICCSKPLMVVERGTEKQITEVFSCISQDTGMRNVFKDFRQIRCEPEGGICLGDIEGNKISDLYWGAGMFFPD